MNKPLKKIILIRRLDQVFARLADSREEKQIKLVWARPISGKGQEISILDKDKKEILMLKSLDCLESNSRKIAEEELEQVYLIPIITRILETRIWFGSRYWRVETDRGQQKFAMKDPRKNVIWVTDDNLIIRDTLGNRYEIKSFSALDSWSQAEVRKVI
jgi:hypothetical protein